MSRARPRSHARGCRAATPTAPARSPGPEAALRTEAEAAARATLTAHEDAEWVVAEPWRPLLERAGERGAAAEAAVKQEATGRLENEPKRGSAGLAREFETQARRARRRAHTASLDLSLDLVGAWFRDLVAVATGLRGPGAERRPPRRCCALMRRAGTSRG